MDDNQERIDEVLSIVRCARCGHRLNNEIECPFCSIVEQKSNRKDTLPKWIYLAACFLILGISLLIFFHIYGCKPEEHRKIHKTSFTPYSEPKFTKEGELTFFSQNNKKIITIDIEIADTREEITRGLMYRHTMSETQGMFFVHGLYKYPFSWMKNTYIPLDMIFIDKKMQIVKIKKNTTPLSEELIGVPKETYYTIEVNSGFCDQHGLKIGDSIKALKIP